MSCNSTLNFYLFLFIELFHSGEFTLITTLKKKLLHFFLFIESGVSSPSPSELGKSENEDNEKSKLEHRHSLPHQTQNCR